MWQRRVRQPGGAYLSWREKKKTSSGFERNRGDGTWYSVGGKKVFVGMCCRESLAAWLVAWLGARHGAPRWLGVAPWSGIAGCVEEGREGNDTNG